MMKQPSRLELLREISEGLGPITRAERQSNEVCVYYGGVPGAYWKLIRPEDLIGPGPSRPWTWRLHVVRGPFRAYDDVPECLVPEEVRDAYEGSPAR
ncbi:MAG TPA: hypothetical protein VEL76_04170 [Gemmataceae bacterium]|nr:hypothetical protein [Gemmataceae bacterium]